MSGTGERADGLDRFASMPGWLRELGDGDLVTDALRAAVPGVRRASLHAVRLKSERWTARCTLEVMGPGEEERTVLVGARIVPPGEPEPTTRRPPEGTPDDPGWRCWVPELRLELTAEPTADAGLPSLPALTDPDRARRLLEDAIRAGSPAYRNLRILRCVPEVMRYSPGSRCTIRYRLELPPEPEAAGWPDTVVAKTYHRPDKGRVAWKAMRALWHSRLAGSDVVAIAEPLAWVPELNVLIQGPVRHDRTVQDLLVEAVATGREEQHDRLLAFLRRSAAGLAELHASGAPSTVTATWQDELAEVHQVLGRLVPRVPQLEGAADPFLRDAERLSASAAPDPARPAHRSFRPAQVLIDGDSIAFIDFDGFCHAEPALDVALFRATLRDVGMRAAPPDDHTRRLADLDELGEAFLAHYETLAPVSRARVALWEGLDLFTNVLHAWSKVQPDRLRHAFALLRHHTAQLEAARAGH